MFTENSALVKIWVDKINKGEYTLEQVPNLSNLKSVVEQVVMSQ